MQAATASAVLSRGQGSAFPPDPLSARTLCALDPVSWLSPTPIAPGSEASRRRPVPRLPRPPCFFHEPRLSAEAPEMHPAPALQAAPTPGGVREDTVSPVEGDRGRKRLLWGLTTKHPRRSKDDNR